MLSPQHHRITQNWPAASGQMWASVPTTYLPRRIQKNQGTLYRLMGLKTPRYFRQNSDLYPTPFWWGTDCDVACAKRDERQFSKAAQARNCPMPDAFLVGYTEERAKCSKKKISKEQQKETEA